MPVGSESALRGVGAEAIGVCQEEPAVDGAVAEMPAVSAVERGCGSDRLGAEGACRVGGQEFPGAQGAYLAYVGFPVFRLGKRPLCPLRRSPERPSIPRENGGALRFLGRGSQMGKWRKTWELMGFRL